MPRPLEVAHYDIKENDIHYMLSRIASEYDRLQARCTKLTDALICRSAHPYQSDGDAQRPIGYLELIQSDPGAAVLTNLSHGSADVSVAKRLPWERSSSPWLMAPRGGVVPDQMAHHNSPSAATAHGESKSVSFGRPQAAPEHRLECPRGDGQEAEEGIEVSASCEHECTIRDCRPSLVVEIGDSRSGDEQRSEPSEKPTRMITTGSVTSCATGMADNVFRRARNLITTASMTARGFASTSTEQSHVEDMFNGMPSAYRKSVRSAMRSFREKSRSTIETASSLEAMPWYRRFAHDMILRSAFVETFTAFVICTNAATIGLSCDIARNSMVWFYLDCVFLSFYLAERVTKVSAQGCVKYFVGPDRRWNIFETALVVMGTFELVFDVQARMVGGSTDGSTMVLLRIVRLGRIVKIVRLFRLQIFCELLVMVDGLLYGAKTLMWSVLLICLPLYVVALVFRETVGTSSEPGTAAESFATLPMSFFTMFRCIVGSDCAEAGGRPVFLLVTDQAGWVYGAVYLCFVFFMTFGLFNVIIAVYVENTVAKVKVNELSLKRQRLEDDERLVSKTSELINVVWLAANERWALSGTVYTEQEFMKFEITPEFFADLCKSPRFRDVLRELDVNDDDQLDLFNTLDVDGSGTLSLEELIMGIIKLRGDARRADIIAVGLMARNVQHTLRRLEERLTQDTGTIRKDISTVMDTVKTPISNRKVDEILRCAGS